MPTDFAEMDAQIDSQIASNIDDINFEFPTTNKYTNLQNRKQAKTTRLGGLSVQSGNLLGMEDADGALHIDSFDNDTRLSPLDGQRYDAVELKHGNNPYDMLGKTKAERDAGEFGKSQYSMQMQREQTARMVNKPVDAVTEQDMLDVGNWQQIQALSDIANADDIAAGKDRWQAPFIQNSTQTDLTGRGYRDENGELVAGTGEIPLNIPISYVADGSKGGKGRELAAIVNKAGTVDITGLAARDTLLNAFAGSKPGKYSSGPSAALLAARDAYDKTNTPSGGDSDGYVGELVDRLQGSGYNLLARASDAVNDLTKDTVLGDVTKAYDNIVNPSGIVGTSNQADVLKDHTKALLYAGVREDTVKEFQVSMKGVSNNFQRGNYAAAAIGALKLAPEILADSAAESAAIALIPGGVSLVAGLRTKEYNDEYKKNNDGMSMSLGKLTETFLEQVVVLGLEKIIVRTGVGDLIDLGKGVISKGVSILKSAGGEALQEYLEGVTEDMATEKVGSTTILDKLTSDKNKESAFIGGIVGGGTKGAGTGIVETVVLGNKLLTPKVDSTNSDTINEFPPADTNPEVYKNLSELGDLDVERINAEVGALPEAEIDAIFANNISDDDIKAHVKAVGSGGNGVLRPFEEAIVKNVYSRGKKAAEAKLGQIAELRSVISDNEKAMADGTAADEDGNVLTEEEVQVQLKLYADQRVQVDAMEKQQLDSIVEMDLTLEPILNRKTAVYNNRPLGEINKDIAETKENTPEMKILLIEKMLAESEVIGLADKDGVTLKEGEKTKDRDTQTMKVYGGFDSKGNYYKGLYQYAQGLLSGSQSAKYGLEKFMASQENKLEVAKQLASSWKEGDGTIEAVYGQDKSGNDVVFQYHGPQSDKSIAQIENEVRLFQKVYDTIVNDKFEVEVKEPWFTKTYSKDSTKAVSLIERLLDGTFDRDSLSEEGKAELDQFLANNGKLVEEVAKKLKDVNNEKVNADEKRTDETEETGTKTKEVTGEERLLEEVTALVNDVRELQQSIIGFDNSSNIVKNYLKAVDNVLGAYEAIYGDVVGKGNRATLTKAINGLMEEVGIEGKAKGGKVTKVETPVKQESKPVEETPAEPEPKVEVKEEAVEEVIPVVETDEVQYQDELQEISNKVAELGDKFEFDDTTPNSKYFGLNNTEKIKLLDAELGKHKVNVLLEDNNVLVLEAVTEAIKGSNPDVTAIIKTIVGCK